MKQLVISPLEVDPEGKINLKGDRFHYLAKVRRVRPGDRLNLLMEEFSAEAEVWTVGEGVLTLKLRESPGVAADRKESRPLFLFPALLKGSKLDDLVRQAVEAGASGIFPFAADHSISKLETQDKPKRLTRWAAIIREAVQQCGATRVPDCGVLSSVSELLSFWNNRGLLLFFHEKALAQESLHGYLSTGSGPIGLIIGPEGGLSPGEILRIKGSGGNPAYLGDRVLRAETASIFALASVRILLEERTSWKIP